MKFKKGDRVKVIVTPAGKPNSGGQGTYSSDPQNKRDEVRTITNILGEQITLDNGGWYYEWELVPNVLDRDFINNIILTKRNSINEMESEISLWESRLEFLDVNGLEEFDEDQFKAFTIIKTVKSDNMTDLEMATFISKLLRG